MLDVHNWWGEEALRQPETMADESSTHLRTTTTTMFGTATTTGDATASPAARSASCPRRTILERLFPISTTPTTTSTVGTGAVDVVVADNGGTVAMGNDDDVEIGRGGDGREGAIRPTAMSPECNRDNRNSADAEADADEEALFRGAADSDKRFDGNRRNDDDTDSIDESSSGRPPCAICLELLGES
jgi:hypothetical protein